MKRLLLFCLTILCAASVYADTTLVRPMLSVVGNSANFQPFTKMKNWMVDGTGSYIYVTVRLGGADGTAQKLSVLKSADNGATWSVDSTFLTGGTSVSRINAYARKDTLYLMHNLATPKYGRVSRHRAGTAFSAAADTMQLKAWDTATSGAFGGGGIAWIGDTFLYAQTHTTGSSVVLGYTVSGFGASPTWVQVDSATHSLALDAYYIPVEDLHGILIVGSGGAAMFGDIASGFDTLATTTVSPGGATVPYRTAFAVDSLSTDGILPDTAIIHKITQNSEEIIYERYLLVNTSTGADFWTRTHTATLATTAEMPTPSTTGAEGLISFGYPFVQVVRGTDKVLAGYVFWDDVAVTDSTKLVYHLSNDNGQNWGARTTFRMKGDVNYRTVIAAPTIDEAAGVVYSQAVWADSISSGVHKDTIRVFNWTIGSVNDPIHTLTQVKIGHNRAHLKDSVIPVNGTVDSLKLFIKLTNPPTDVWRELDTNATTRVAKSYFIDTGLAINTKYYYRWAIKDDVGWDTSAVDSFTTLAALDPVGKNLTTFLGATTAHIQCSTLTAKVEAYNGTLIKAKIYFDDLTNPPTGAADSILLATYPKDTIVLTGLEVNTKTYFRWILTDSGMVDTSAVDSFTTGTGVTIANTVIDTNGNSLFAQEILTANVGVIQYLKFYASTAAGTIFSNIKDSIYLPTSTDTVQALGLTPNTVYYLAVIAIDSQVADTVWDTVTTKNIDIDLSGVYSRMDSIQERLDTLLDGFVRSGYNINNLIAAAVYGYITSPANDRIPRISDSTAFGRWIWDYLVNEYADAADSNKAGYVQFRENNFDPVDDTIKKSIILTNGDKTGYSLTSPAYDSVTNPIIAEIEAHQATVSSGSSGSQSQSLGTNILPYPVLAKDTTTIPLATAYQMVKGYNGVYLGWHVSATKNGTVIPLVSVDSIGAIGSPSAGTFPIEDLTTYIEFTGTHSAGVYDSVRFRSPVFKVHPGFYKYGARMMRGLVTGVDTLEIELRNSSGVILDSFFVNSSTGLVDSIFKDISDEYFSTTTVDAYMVLRFVDNHSAGTPYMYWTYAFMNLMGYNYFAVDTSIGVAPDVGMGRMIVNGGAATDASVWTTAYRDSVLNRLVKVQDSLFALLDTMQDGVDGPLVNVGAIYGDNAAAAGLAYILDSGSTGTGKMNIQQVQIGPPSSALDYPLRVVGVLNGVPVISVEHPGGNAAAVSLQGGGPGLSSTGGTTAASGLSVAGSGGAQDVTGTFVDSVNFTGNVTFDLTGLGTNVRQKIYARDTSGTDEYVADVFITIRAIGTVTNAAGPLVTNDSGLCNFTLPNGTFEVLTRKGGYQFITDTITVTGDGTFTIDGYNTNAISQCAVWGYVGEINSTLYGNATVVFTLANKVNDTCNDVILTNFTTSTRTDQNGRFEKNLIRSSCLSGEQYNVKVLLRDGSSRTYTFTVPDQTSYQLIWN